MRACVGGCWRKHVGVFGRVRETETEIDTKKKNTITENVDKKKDT